MAIYAALCVVCASCRDSTGLGACFDYALHAVAVKVLDDATGMPVASGATLVLRDGEFSDSISVPADPAYDGIWVSTLGTLERAGTYDITVRRAGYADWSRSAVRVSAGRCHVRPVQLTARLVPVAEAAPTL